LTEALPLVGQTVVEAFEAPAVEYFELLAKMCAPLFQVRQQTSLDPSQAQH